MRISDEIGPAKNWATLVPADADLDPPVLALWVNQACDLVLKDEDGTSVTFTVPAAGPVDLAPTRVVSCSAGTVIGLY